MAIGWYLAVSAIIFSIGAAGVSTSRNRGEAPRGANPLRRSTPSSLAAISLNQRRVSRCHARSR